MILIIAYILLISIAIVMLILTIGIIIVVKDSKQQQLNRNKELTKLNYPFTKLKV